ncbi:DNA-directed RNA polymerase subunit beta [Sulfidibacter corallicola]|uniref:DNA-directed RNA polymerase subunit beta n=1 Tax=Sulfidibacter corallicola TaxID=2818388 RepID=A0A8A4TSJ1_SULCO|nr:DNA-directed RNA polymerase subunit beta [Sulfidibacter corallicola]QTD52926.1 DNA-directed RNA polymerase subunit beta [Sulfidibacter corallicola]
MINIQWASYDYFLQMDKLPNERSDMGLKAVFESLFPISDFKDTCSLEFVDYTIGNWECRCGKLQGIHHNRTQCNNCSHMIISDQYSGHWLTCDSCGATNENQKAICDVCGTSVKLKVKYSVDECKERGLTYDAPLKVTVRLVVWDKEENANDAQPLPRDIKEQEVYFGDIPLMTEQGTFIINGTERVIVSQMHRSPGVFFSEGDDQGTFHAQIIPYRGSWIEFETDTKGLLYVRIDRKRKFPGTGFIRALGCLDGNIHSNESILRKFQEPYKIRFQNGKIQLGLYEPALGTKFLDDVMSEKDEAIATGGRKVSRAAQRALRKAGVEWYAVQPETLPKITLLADLVNEETGEIIAEANTTIDEDLLNAIFESGVDQADVFFPETDPAGDLVSNTLMGDQVRSPEEALVEIYRKMRPGDPPTVESSRKLFMQMFFDPQRYDFSRVGRLKFCTKLNLEENLDQRVLTPEDFYATIEYLLKLHRNIGKVDDIDHLGNRRVRSVGELLENQLRVGLVRMQRAIKEKMSLYNDLNTIMPHELINAKPVMASIKEFFGSSQLSQFMDQTNPLSEITHKRRLSALGPGGLSRERAGFEVRDVHTSHYGRICPIETPEGPNIGLISSLSCYARINEFGFIESPYYRVENGRVIREVRVINPGDSGHKKGDVITADQMDELNKQLTGDGKEPVSFDPFAHYLSAWEEDKYVIAQANAPLDDDDCLSQEQVNSRCGGEFKLFPRETINYIDVSPKQVVSVAASLIPFLENDDANRALMGSNMQRQAVPLLKTEAPLVGTGMEYIAARDSGATLVCRNNGWVETVDAEHIVIRLEGARDDVGEIPDFGVDVYYLSKFKRSNQNTCFNQKPLVKKGQYVRKNQVIADGACTECGELALGKNVVVAFMPWRGYNFEDAILISERVVKEDVYTSIHIEEFEIEARDTKLGPEEITRDIPNLSEEFLKDLDDSGIIRIGASIKPGSILVGKVTPKGETQLTPEEKLLRAIFGEKAGDVRDASLYAPPGIRGTVVDVKIFSRKGVEKDSRSLQIEEEQTLKLKQNLEDQEQIIQNQAVKNIRRLLKDKEVLDDVLNPLTGEVVVKAGETIDPAQLEGLKLSDLKRIDVTDPNVQLEIANISSKTNQQIEVARQVFEEEVEKLKRGDELPPGVIKLVKVFVAVKRKLQVGDKMAGRHGNKGVVSLILPEEDMPYMPDGTPVDVVLNPLGVPSRMNVGQILETHLGMAGKRLGRHFATPVFDGARELDIKQLLGDADFPVSGKTVLYDGRTGEPFEQPVTVGVIYILKLHHLVDNKIHSRSIGPYSLITQQPLGGKAQFGGQRFGEMEVWALEAYGAAHILQELLTVKSDDVQGRTRIYEAIVKGDPACEPGIPESFNVLVKELQSLALDVQLFKEGEFEKWIVEPGESSEE